ncbi:MAG: hypothetical protein HY606_08635 [Planctomycetes bacterium]|nr:hypothetical protein [Planctomycetota bacterium]
MPFPNTRLKKKIGELLLDAGLVSLDDIKKVLDHQKQNGGLIGEILVQLGIVREADIAYAVAKQFNLPYIECDNYLVPKSAKDLLSVEIMKREGFVVLDQLGKAILVAFALLPRKEVLEPLGDINNISIFISTPSSVVRAIEKNYE